MQKPPTTLCSALLLLIALLLAKPALATTFVVNNMDAPGEGLNDTAPVTAVAGNIATSIGAQRLAVIDYATALVASVVNSSEPIAITAKFNALTCDASSAILGEASPQGFYKNTSNAPLANTYYSQAQANSHAGSDVATQVDDLTMTFNDAIDNNNNCLNNRNWYYGLDGNPPGNDIDFLSTVLHEIVHGLGFITLVNLTTGAKQGGGVCDSLPAGGCDDAYMLNMEDHSTGSTWPNLSDAQRAASATDDPDLHITGSNVQANLAGITGGINQGHARLHAPSPMTGSSVDHFSNALDPFELMEHQLTGTADSLGLATFVLQDMGWSVNNNPPPIVSEIGDQLMLASQTLKLSFALLDNNHAASSLAVDADSSNLAVIPSTGLVTGGSGRLRTLDISPAPGSTGLVTVTIDVSDGSAMSSTDFIVEVTDNLPPAVNITSPADGEVFYTAQQSFSGAASDFEDGNISATISWSSSLDGALGSAASITPSLSDGQHTITATVTDSGGKIASAIIDMTVDQAGDADSDGLYNALELMLGTDPEDSDSDNDYSSDFIEVNRDKDPSNYTVGIDTDPNDSDTDGDGVLDGADYAPLDPNAGDEQVPLMPLAAYAVLAALFTLLARRNRQRYRT